MPAEAIFNLAAIVLLFVVLSVAAVTDLLHRKVYNWTTFPAIALGLTLGYAAGDWGFVTLGQGGAGLVDHLAGFACGLVVLFVVYFGGGVGGGDVKLMAAVGAIMGLHFVIGAMFWSSLVGAIMATWVLVMRRRLWWGLKRSMRHTASIAKPTGTEEEEAAAKLSIPMGTAIAFGTMLTWFMTELPNA